MILKDFVIAENSFCYNNTTAKDKETTEMPSEYNETQEYNTVNWC